MSVKQHYFEMGMRPKRFPAGMGDDWYDMVSAGLQAMKREYHDAEVSPA